MNITPWREIARPHKDVLEGRFQQSEFAADITQVYTGTAPAEYQDAEQFFARTFITEGMRLLLVSVARRLAGLGGDPVIQLQTSFGGGKTHTMLAVLHLAARTVGIDKLAGIPPLLDEAGIDELPQAKTAVIDGIALSVSQGRPHGDITAHTLWGEVAWQLLGEAGYALVATSDREGTAPGKDILTTLLQRAAPCVVLIDELQKFCSDLTPGKPLAAGTYEANLKFVQALTEAFKAVPNAILLASLPKSDTEAGDVFGQKSLVALEKHFGRVESVWKPVAAEEAFEIVRRRLFESAGDHDRIEDISRQFCNYYRKNARHFPAETQSNDYFERLCSAYPIHPEIFDRLYQDWSTLDKFQRTRGVLQYMAVIIHRLWNDNNQDALIMPGSIPLEDSQVRIKSIHYLPPGWEPILEGEVDGHRSKPSKIDGGTRFGSVQAARRTMRTIFLGSAPSVPSQAVKGIRAERVLLGSAQPGQTVGIFTDVLSRLRDQLHYLYSEQDRYWLDTRANLSREMESRRGNIDLPALHQELKQQVTGILERASVFAGIHVFTASNDVPDDDGDGLRLVVLPPENGFTKGGGGSATTAAEEILQNRGAQPRQRRNRLIFFAAETSAIGRLNQAGRTYLAWCEIVTDIEQNKLNLDLLQANQTRDRVKDAKNKLQQAVREAYKWLLCPRQVAATDQRVEWDSVSVATNAPKLTQEIAKRLREEEWIIQEWAPFHLKQLLDRWYFKPGVRDVSALKVYQDTRHYLYLPRLVNQRVYLDALAQGLNQTDHFGFAANKDGNGYSGFLFGSGGVPTLDAAAVLIECSAAQQYAADTAPIEKPLPESSGGSGRTPVPTPPNAPPGTPTTVDGNAPASGVADATPIKTRFHGTIRLNSIKATIDFDDVVKEVVQHFIANPDMDVSISVDIEVKSTVGFDAKLERTVNENCQTLNFTNAEFEQD